MGFRIGAADIAEAGRISHPADPGETFTPQIGRSVVIGDALYTLSYSGLAANRLDNLASLSFIPFPREPRAAPDPPEPPSHADPGAVVPSPR